MGTPLSIKTSKLFVVGCLCMLACSRSMYAQTGRNYTRSQSAPALSVGVVEISIGMSDQEARRRLQEYYFLRELEGLRNETHVQVEQHGKTFSDGYPVVGSIRVTNGRVVAVGNNFSEERYQADDYTLLLERAFGEMESRTAMQNCEVSHTRLPGTRSVTIAHQCGRYRLVLSLETDGKNNPNVSASIYLR